MKHFVAKTAFAVACLSVRLESGLTDARGKVGNADGVIEGRLQFPDRKTFNQTVLISLNHQELTTYSRADGSFAIHHVPPGVHVLDVYSTTFHFPQVKLQFLEDDMQNPKCLEYAYPGSPKRNVEHPLTLTVLAKYDYFEKRRGFSMLGLLRNPMIIMMLFSVGLMVMMPKLMEGLEPEERERMKKQMEMQQDPTKMLNSLWDSVSGAPPEPPAPKKKAGKKQ